MSKERLKKSDEEAKKRQRKEKRIHNIYVGSERSCLFKCRQSTPQKKKGQCHAAPSKKSVLDHKMKVNDIQD
jgi:hypothetical protein